MGKFLTEGCISEEIIAGFLKEDSGDYKDGAISIFIGKVRADIHEDKKVTAIEYFSYPEMVELTGEKIAETIKSSFPDVKNVRLIHSTGVVKTGEASLAVMVSAGHRDEATRACREVVEMIKASFPVWKKEYFSDSSNEWKEV
jgi:molybdopterin synthase catalytic subunit